MGSADAAAGGPALRPTSLSPDLFAAAAMRAVAKDLMAMKVDELKEELEARGVEGKSGNKAWLRRRLHAAIVREHLEGQVGTTTDEAQRYARRHAFAEARKGLYTSHAFGPPGKEVRVLILDARCREICSPRSASRTPSKHITLAQVEAALRL